MEGLEGGEIDGLPLKVFGKVGCIGVSDSVRCWCGWGRESERREIGAICSDEGRGIQSESEVISHFSVGSIVDTGFRDTCEIGDFVSAISCLEKDFLEVIELCVDVLLCPKTSLLPEGGRGRFFSSLVFKEF